jgi:hypothetical protein
LSGTHQRSDAALQHCSTAASSRVRIEELPPRTEGGVTHHRIHSNHSERSPNSARSNPTVSPRADGIIKSVKDFLKIM